MTHEEFQDRFQTCVRERGQDYVAARDAILRAARDQDLRPELKARARSEDWAVATTARILLSWIRRPRMTGEVVRAVREDPPVLRAAGYAPAPGTVARAVAALRPSPVPRLIELLTKTRELGHPFHTQIMLQALVLLNPPEAVEPLLDMLDTVDDDTRLLVLSALTDLSRHAPRRVADGTRGLFDDENEPVAVRAGAALCLGRCGDRHIRGELARWLDDVRRPREQRVTAVRALRYLWSSPRLDEAPVATAAVPGLSDTQSFTGYLLHETDQAVALEMVGALTVLAATPPPAGRTVTAQAEPSPRSQQALDALKEAEEHHEIPVIQRAAKEAVRRISSGQSSPR